jgi:hypothetical protein
MNEWKWHITYRPRCHWNTEEKVSLNLKEVYWTVPSGENDEQKPLALSFKNLIEEKEKSIEDKEVAVKIDGMCQWLTED